MPESGVGSLRALMNAAGSRRLWKAVRPVNCGCPREPVDEWAQPLSVDSNRAARLCEMLVTVWWMVVRAVP